MENKITFRLALESDFLPIWKLIAYAIEARRIEKSNQWQDGYPNPQIIHNDIAQHHGYVLTHAKEILFYAALIIGKEPAYEALKTGWITQNTPYAVIHRMASSPKAKGKGLSQTMMDYLETLAKKEGMHSIRIDTNFDNLAMLHVLEKRTYQYCGKVYFRDSERMAFEKIIVYK